MPEDNGRREAGRISATLESIDNRLKHIEESLDKVSDWRIDVETRLATGVEKFHQLEKRDNNSAIVASIIGIIAALAAGIASVLWK